MLLAADRDIDTFLDPTASLAVEDLATQCRRLFEPDTDIVVLNPALRPTAPSQLARLNPVCFSELQFQGAISDLQWPLQTALRQEGSTPDAVADWVVQDILRLATLLGRFFATAEVKLRLEVVTDDACRKFHIDNVVSRLICTYCGPGTQFSSNPDSTDAASIWQAPTGAPVLLKGRKWPQTEALTLAHRSPPIENSGRVRWVLVLEPVISAFAEKNLSQTALKWAADQAYAPVVERRV